MVRELEMDLFPDMLRRDCRQCGEEQSHYRMGESETDSEKVDFQCMGCMMVVSVDLRREIIGLQGNYVKNNYIKSINKKTFTPFNFKQSPQHLNKTSSSKNYVKGDFTF